MEEKEAEIAQLQEQMRQLATEKERQQQSKERKMAELRRKLETSQRTSAKRLSKSEASVVIYADHMLKLGLVPKMKGLV